MDENRFEGSARNLGGRVQEGVGRATGDTKSKVEGVMNQAAGTAQNLYGQAADVVRQNASPVEAWLRDKIETQPYTTVIAALGKIARSLKRTEGATRQKAFSLGVSLDSRI